MSRLSRTGHPFTDLVTLEPDAADPDRFVAVIDPMWTIGPKVHGGALLAVLAAAARDRLRADGGAGAESGAGVDTRQPLAVTASYLSAPDPGPLELTTDVVKRGRRVVHVVVSALQQGREYVRALVVLGHPDATAAMTPAGAVEVDMPAEPGELGLPVDPAHPLASVVHIAQGIDMAIDPRSAPFMTGETGHPEIRVWLRLFDQDAVSVDTRALFALMAGDVSPPITLNLGRVGWAPTVQMSSYLRRIPDPGWLRLVTRATAIGTGWMDEDHLVIDGADTVVAQCRQLAMPPLPIGEGG